MRGTVAIPMARFLSRHHLEIALAYLVGFVFLDWVSYVYPYARLSITPWNPPTGLSFALILLLGTDFLPWPFVAPVLADGVVRGFPLPFGAELATALIIGGGYVAATTVLLSPCLFYPIARRRGASVAGRGRCATATKSSTHRCPPPRHARILRASR
jgi:two-component system, LuxR family, sensor kinase FixL